MYDSSFENLRKIMGRRHLIVNAEEDDQATRRKQRALPARHQQEQQREQQQGENAHPAEDSGSSESGDEDSISMAEDTQLSEQSDDEL